MSGQRVCWSDTFSDQGKNYNIHCTPPTHIWTYATASTLPIRDSGGNERSCPCNTNPGTSPPSYVGSDYYCEAAEYEHGVQQTDPLWDGLQCEAEMTCCNHTGLPWFIKNTPSPTAASINVRVCYKGVTSVQQIGVERLELYIK